MKTKMIQMKDYISPETIVSEARMSRTKNRKQTYLLVEGDADIAFFKNIIDRTCCKVKFCNGKSNVEKAIENCNKAKLNGIIGIVDRDFDLLLNNNQSIENLFKTDTHDLETMSIRDGAFERLNNEYGDDEKIEIFENRNKESVLKRILTIGSILGKVRIADMLNKFEIGFNDMQLEDYILDELSLDYERYISNTWYVLSGMYQHKMETEENTAVIKNVNVYNMAGTMDGETFVQASDFTNHLNQAEYEISWNRTEADEEGNTVYTVTLSAKIPWNGIQTDAEAYIEYEDISLVDATTGMVLPQHVAATDSSMAMMAEVACAGTTYQVAATEDTETTFGDWTVEDGSEYPMVTYYEIKETYKVTAPAEYKGLLFVLQTQRTAEEYENGIVKGLGTDEAHTFDGTINDGSVAIELDRDYEYINAE